MGAPAQTAPNPFAGFGNTITANPAAPAAPTNPFSSFSSFGNPPALAAPAPTPATTSSFGAFASLLQQPAQQAQQAQPQQALMASVDQPPIGGDIPSFNLLPGSISGLPSTLSAYKKKQPNFFAPMIRPTHVANLRASTLNGGQSGVGGSITGGAGNPGNAGLRGFVPNSKNLKASQQAAIDANARLLRSTAVHPKRAATVPVPRVGEFMGGTLSESKSLIPAEAFTPPTSRLNVKKLILEKDRTEDELTSIIERGTGLKRNASSSDRQLLPLVEKKSATILKTPAIRSTTPKPKLEKGDYYTEPSEEVLRSTPFKDLESVATYKCGRVGYGDVEFLRAVNLTNFGDIGQIPGKIIVFEEKECTVYPNEQEKPERGEGLNVPARIRLFGCWAFNKSTKEPIRDPNHPKQISHLKKLKSMADTEFVSFDVATGEWVFIVQHFTRYGMESEEEEDDNEVEEDEDEEEEEEEEESSAVEEYSPFPKQESVLSEEDLSMEAPALAPIHTRRSVKELVIKEAGDMSLDTDEQEEYDEEEDEQVPWPAQLGVDPQRVRVMQNTLFQQKSAPFTKPVNNKTLGKHPRDFAAFEDQMFSDAAPPRTSSEVNNQF